MITQQFFNVCHHVLWPCQKTISCHRLTLLVDQKFLKNPPENDICKDIYNNTHTGILNIYIMCRT